MEKALASADKEVLGEVVRLIQKMGLRGSHGAWKDFLDSRDQTFGAGLSDPTKRSRDVLVAFLESCQRKKRGFLFKLIKHCTNQRALEQFTKEFRDNESPQQRLVRMTLEHPQYKQRFSFPSLDEGWMVVPLGNISDAMKSKKMVAVDCEMVGCQDGTDALVRVCAVDEKLKVILDEKVNPGKDIADYRTEITGIDAKDLEGVTCSLDDIQKSLKQLLAKGTILIGHSLHNDLQALKIDHLRVIDTSYIFKCKDLPTSYTPSLNNLCKSVLGDPIRKEGEPHDCRNDALAAMKLVLSKLEHGFEHPIFVPIRKVSDSDLAKLLLHKIPLQTPCQELRKLFPPEHDIDIQTDLRVRNQCYSTYAVFKDAKEADVAFRQIEGIEKKDLSGRPQKLVRLELSTGQIIDIFVRKMTADFMLNGTESSKKRSHLEDGNQSLNGTESSKKRSDVEDGNQDSKRQRTCLYQCEHAKEMDALKQKLHEREEEIFNLQKNLSALTEGSSL